MIKENLKDVKEKIAGAIEKSGRSPEDVTLIAVSKTKPVSLLMEAYDEGMRDFGENKVQELCEKYEIMPKDIRWHMIGHLQRNKVKYIVDKVALIHSVDSLRLAEQIETEAAKKNVTVNILVEVNVACEDSKFGVMTDGTYELIKNIAKLEHVKIKGLMTIAPYTENPEENRKYFSKLKQLSVDIMNKKVDNISMDMLSMGMTGDYGVAIEEGATFVRVGTGIFGERDYNI
ncbi:MAG: YggS family pyridoxal phosphate-dependent enzyme [Lachnospiraceae bacterium]|nr:YggS family pyridoxal phosphate-dependent enzyme [Lachnospiraceae bacterium]